VCEKLCFSTVFVENDSNLSLLNLSLTYYRHLFMSALSQTKKVERKKEEKKKKRRKKEEKKKKERRKREEVITFIFLIAKRVC
jgi:nitrate reductase NapE component